MCVVRMSVCCVLCTVGEVVCSFQLCLKRATDVQV